MKYSSCFQSETDSSLTCHDEEGNEPINLTTPLSPGREIGRKNFHRGLQPTGSYHNDFSTPGHLCNHAKSPPSIPRQNDECHFAYDNCLERNLAHACKLNTALLLPDSPVSNADHHGIGMPSLSRRKASVIPDVVNTTLLLLPDSPVSTSSHHGIGLLPLSRRKASVIPDVVIPLEHNPNDPSWFTRCCSIESRFECSDSDRTSKDMTVLNPIPISMPRSDEWISPEPQRYPSLKRRRVSPSQVGSIFSPIG